MLGSPDRGSGLDDRLRGQSEVLGIVLLIGMVAIGAIGVLVVAGAVTSDLTHQAETERVEQAFVELGKTVGTATIATDVSHSVTLEAGEHGAVTREQSGWIKVTSDGLDEPINETIGTIEYEGEDGSYIAFEAGGVFREQGDQTVIVSNPPIHYDAASETLTLPITTVSGDERLGSGNVVISHDETRTYRDVNVVENETIEVTIRSDYYRGWIQFFESEAGDTSIRNVDHENRTVTALLGYDEIENAFSDGLGVPSEENHDVHHQVADEEDINDNVPMPPMDDAIEDMIDRIHAGKMETDANLSAESDPSGVYGDGTYYIDEIREGDWFEFDISDGNVTVVVEGNITVTEHITVTNPQDETALRVYSGGELLEIDGEVCAEGCNGEDTKHVQLYGTSEMGVNLGPTAGGSLDGLLYVASNEEKDWPTETQGGQCNDMDVHPQVLLHGNQPLLNGSIVAYSICAHSADGNFEYDTTLDDEDIDVYPEGYNPPPQVTYLNVAHTELVVENE